MERFKNFLAYIRNGLCFSFTWLLLMLMEGAVFSGIKAIEVGFLFKVFLMCLYGAVCFAVCFTDFLIRTKGFIFRLTILFITFIPVEVFTFYKLNIFAGKGTALEWTIFTVIVISFYITCLVLDRTKFKDKGERYTQLLNEYNRRQQNE
ncbi:MAG: hypothetical protein J5717_03480 [Lachnospiraceae bacterium]|nr:hypothetical protein [Lachnospiraceae bacterium]MBO4824600.1 hypothetical protein [Lachnospiraceae bacterium]MBR5994233.1 hypothetical protein [Lachnospiraceae bacterium]